MATERERSWYERQAIGEGRYCADHEVKPGRPTMDRLRSLARAEDWRLNPATWQTGNEQVDASFARMMRSLGVPVESRS